MLNKNKKWSHCPNCCRTVTKSTR